MQLTIFPVKQSLAIRIGASEEMQRTEIMHSKKVQLDGDFANKAHNVMIFTLFIDSDGLTYSFETHCSSAWHSHKNGKIPCNNG